MLDRLFVLYNSEVGRETEKRERGRKGGRHSCADRHAPVRREKQAMQTRARKKRMPKRRKHVWRKRKKRRKRTKRKRRKRRKMRKMFLRAKKKRAKRMRTGRA
jgi:hypothetical protein